LLPNRCGSRKRCGADDATTTQKPGIGSCRRRYSGQLRLPRFCRDRHVGTAPQRPRGAAWTIAEGVHPRAHAANPARSHRAPQGRRRSDRLSRVAARRIYEGAGIECRWRPLMHR
jgi:hypothetical protein